MTDHLHGARSVQTWGMGAADPLRDGCTSGAYLWNLTTEILAMLKTQVHRFLTCPFYYDKVMISVSL